MVREASEQDNGPVVGPHELSFVGEPTARGMTRLRVTLGSQLIHCDSLKLDSAARGAGFTAELVARAKAEHGLEPGAAQVERGLPRADPGTSAGSAASTGYRAVEGGDDPERDGLYIDGAASRPS